MALGQESLSKFSFRRTDIDRKDPDVVFPSKLTAWPACRVSSARLPRQRGRGRRWVWLHCFGGLDTDESACPVLILYHRALWWWALALSAAPGRRTTAACVGLGGSGGFPRPAACGGRSLWWVDRSGSVGAWSLRVWGLLRLVRRSGRGWNQHVLMAMVAPIGRRERARPRLRPWCRPVCE